LREKTKQKKPKTKQQNKTKQNKKIPLTPQQSIPLHTHEQQEKRHNYFPNCCIPSEIVASMITDLTTYPKTNPKPKNPPKQNKKKKNPSLIMKFLLCSMKPEV
jgi:hypothetical protein